MADAYALPEDRTGRILHGVATAWAAAGGLALIGIACLTTINVVLTTTLRTHIPGEFEIADIGVAMIVFTFMPLAQLRRGYVIVDLFTQSASARTRIALDAVAGIAFAVCIALIAWRMFEGGIEMAASGERTPVLNIRYWWAFAVAVPSLALLVAACVHTAWSDLRRLRT